MEERSPEGLLAAALKYAIVWDAPVIPLKDDKTPRTQNGSKDATTDEAQIRKWWGMWPTANIGIATGHNGLFVIDIDGDLGLESYKALASELGQIKTLHVKTGNGYHLYLRAPVEIRNAQSQRAGWEGIDIRGAGGYVVAPPSLHSSGVVYAFADESREIADVPQAWLEAITAPRRSLAPAAQQDSGQPVVSGQRNQTLASLAGTMRDRGMGEQAIAAALAEYNRERCSPPLDEAEVAQIARSISRYEPTNDAAVIVESIEQASDILSGIAEKIKEDPGYAFNEEVLDALLIAEEADGPAHARALAAIKRTRAVSLRMLDKHIKARRQYRREQAGLKGTIELGDMPLELEMPEGYTCRREGVYYMHPENGPERILPVPLYITRRYRTVVEQEERLELQYYRDGEWHTIVADRSMVGSTQGIVGLSDRGLPTTSVNAAIVIKYLSALEMQNLDRIPVEQVTTKAGWIGSQRFFPGAEGDITFQPEHGAQITERSYAPGGNIDEWLGTIGPMLEKYPLMRMHMACSFAAPLLKPCSHRNFVCHLHGDSGSGKTATLMAAMSVWGQPQALVGNFNTTAVGLEHRLGLADGMPVALNERQVANNKVDNLVYMAGEGTGRTRGAKSGGLRAMQTWNMILLTNGEEPLVSDRAPEGARTRVVEAAGEPITDESDARRIYPLVERNYGHAGRQYISHLVKALADDYGFVRRMHDAWHSMMSVMYQDHPVSHTSAIALMCVADVLRQQWLWGVDKEAAEAATYAWATNFAEPLVNTEGSESHREYNFIMDLVNSHRSRFVPDFPEGRVGSPLEPSVMWGVIQNDWVYFNPTILRDELDHAGFRPRAVVRRLGSAGLIDRAPAEQSWTVRKKGARWVKVKIEI